MTSMEWRARITDQHGRVLGAGTLIDAHHVLTAAHVVFGESEVCVDFPGATEGLAATVEVRGAWRELGDREDFGVLRLREPAPVKPCRLADPNALGGGGSENLAALGFPTRHQRDGRIVELRTQQTSWVGGEWLQVSSRDGHVQALDKGFSGAGVYDTVSGTVVGVLTDADLEKTYRGVIGRMLPLAKLRCYWEPLDDLLPLHWLSAPARRELRRLLSGSEVAADLNGVLRSALPWFQVDRSLRSPWDLIRYVAEQNINGDALAWVVRQLAPAVIDDAARAGLGRWLRANFGLDMTEPAVEHRPSIMVQVERRTKGDYEITFSMVENNVARPVDGPFRVDRKPRIRRVIEERLPSLMELAALTGTNWMIEFAVPEKLLGEPFDDFEIREPGAESSRRRPIRSVPVVVRHIDRVSNRGLMAKAMARRRWERLQETASMKPKQVPCHTDQSHHQVLSRFEADEEASTLACATSPPKTVLSAALDSGIPVMLWRRVGCHDESHAECDRFIKDLAGRLVGVPPRQVPDEVKRMRNQALSHPDGERHCGWKLTLFWDDPDRGQDPPLAMERQQHG